MKKLILLLLTFSIYTSLSQSWEKVNYFAGSYGEFLENEQYVFNEYAGIRYTPKNSIDFNNNSNLLPFPPSPNGIGVGKYTVCPDNSILILLGITNDTSQVQIMKVFKSNTDLNDWVDLKLELGSDSKFVNKVIMVDDTTLLGVDQDNNSNLISGRIIKFTYSNSVWKRKVIYDGDPQTKAASYSYNVDLFKRKILIINSAGKFAALHLDSLTFGASLNNLINLSLGVSCKSLHSLTFKDTLFVLVAKSTNFNFLYLLKFDKDLIVSSYDSLPMNYIQGHIYNFNYNNNYSVVTDDQDLKIVYSYDFGKTWQTELKYPDGLFTSQNISSKYSMLTSNGYLFCSEKNTLNAYYTKLYDPSGIEEVVQDNPIYNTTSLELYDILGRSLATFPSYEKLKTEIENYPPPHLIKWRDEKGIFHFEKLK